MKLYELVFDHAEADKQYYGGPNGWKVHLSLLHKQIPVEIIEVTNWEIKYDLTPNRNNGQKTTSPAIELEDGSGKLLCDSFKIAEYLEQTYPDRPSIFTGDATQGGLSAAAIVGKNFARMVDLGLGSSDPQWCVWYDLFAEDIINRTRGDQKNFEYFVSEARLGVGAYENIKRRIKEEDLVARCKLNVTPLIKLLSERPGEFFQGKEPGYADFVIFGRYAMCRNNNPAVAKIIWEDQGKEIGEWVELFLTRFPSVQKHLRSY